MNNLKISASVMFWIWFAFFAGACFINAVLIRDDYNANVKPYLDTLKAQSHETTAKDPGGLLPVDHSNSHNAVYPGSACDTLFPPCYQKIHRTKLNRQ